MKEQNANCAKQILGMNSKFFLLLLCAALLLSNCVPFSENRRRMNITAQFLDFAREKETVFWEDFALPTWDTAYLDFECYGHADYLQQKYDPELNVYENGWGTEAAYQIVFVKEKKMVGATIIWRNDFLFAEGMEVFYPDTLFVVSQTKNGTILLTPQ